MQKIYRITVIGTGQLNGPVRINKTLEFDDLLMASKFRGPNRYEVLTDFAKTHYPGVKVNPKDLAAKMETISIPKKNKQNSKKVSNSGDSIKSVITGMAIGAIVNSFKETDSEDDENNKVSESEDEKLNRLNTYDKINSILDFKYAENSADIANQLETLIIALSSLNDLKYDKTSNIPYRNLKDKFEFGLLKLGQSEDNSEVFKHFKKKLKKARNRRLWKKTQNLFKEN